MPTLCCPPIGLAPIAAEDGRNWMSHLGLSPNRGIAQFLAIPMWFWSILIQTHSKAGLKLATRVAGLYRNLRNLHLVGLCKYWLVVWLPFFIFPYIGNVIIPIDELHHFSEGFFPWPTNQNRIGGQKWCAKSIIPWWIYTDGSPLRRHFTDYLRYVLTRPGRIQDVQLERSKVSRVKTVF